MFDTIVINFDTFWKKIHGKEKYYPKHQFPNGLKQLYMYYDYQLSKARQSLVTTF